MRWRAVIWGMSGVLTIGGLAWISQDTPHSAVDSRKAATMERASGSAVHALEAGLAEASAGGRATRFWRGQQNVDLSDLQQQADRGDIEAQRELGLAYERCFPVLASSADEYLKGIRSMAEHLSTEAERELLIGAAQFRLEQCQSLDHGQIIPAEAARLWLDLAAQGGDLPAQAMAAVRSKGTTEPSRVSVAWERALAASDGRALYALVGNEESSGFTRHLGSIVEPGDAVAVMSVVGCRTGASCQPGGEVMLDLCLNAFHCSDRGFEDLIWQHGQLGDRGPAVHAQVDSVLRAMSRMRKAD